MAALMGTTLNDGDCTLRPHEIRFVPGGGSRVQLIKNQELGAGKVLSVTEPFLLESQKSRLTLQIEERDKLVSS